VPVVIRDATDHEALQLALVENLQREDLNAIEEANGYRRLQEEFHWSQEEMAEKVAKSRPAITNSGSTSVSDSVRSTFSKVLSHSNATWTIR